MRVILLNLYVQVFVTLIILTVKAEDWTSSCSTNCTCKWTNGKKSAICSSLHLNAIPTTLSTEIQVLVLNENHIAYLNREEFTTLGLINLQRIYLKKSNVQFIHKEAFKSLKILVEIDLSDNKIEMFDKYTFSGNDRLRVLYLNGNPLKQLIAYQFPILPHLRTLDLGDCLIKSIDPLAFTNLNLLEFLYLKNNLLESLSEYVFQHMTNLKTLALDENPWKCNCKLRKFRNWYIKSKLNSVSLVCKGPFHHKDKHWENIDEILFGCAPKIEIYSNEDVHNIDIGSNTTFNCLVFGDPLPTITWELNGKSFDNDNILFDEEILDNDRVWSNLTVFNMTSLDAGTYTCSAQNAVGFIEKNISIYLTEIVQHVLVKTPETFWYFGLIMGTFGTVFVLIFFSFIICFCKRTRQQRLPNKNIKGSVSFNDQEKKLLDLSITTTTTNERQDNNIMENNTSTINKSESVIAFDPIELNIENRNGIGTVSTGICTTNTGRIGSIAGGIGGGGNILKHEEFPLNVGVFPPPPEFCSNVVPNPGYGNIFISVSVTQDMLDSSDINIYPDLLNIPKRIDNNTVLPMNVSSFATLPRNNRRGILKKDTNLYPHNEIINYNNLDSCYMNDKQGNNITTKGTCINCIKTQNDCNRLQCTFQTPCLNYDNMGKRITASGNSTLSLPDEERLENESICIEENLMKKFSQVSQPSRKPKSQLKTIETEVISNGSDFVSL